MPPTRGAIARMKRGYNSTTNTSVNAAASDAPTTVLYRASPSEAPILPLPPLLLLLLLLPLILPVPPPARVSS